MKQKKHNNKKRPALMVSSICGFIRCATRKIILPLMASGQALLCHASGVMEDIAKMRESVDSVVLAKAPDAMEALCG